MCSVNCTYVYLVYLFYIDKIIKLLKNFFCATKGCLLDKCIPPSLFLTKMLEMLVKTLIQAIYQGF